MAITSQKIMKKYLVLFFITSLYAPGFTVDVPVRSRRKSRTAFQEEIVECIELLLNDSRDALRACARNIKVQRNDFKQQNVPQKDISNENVQQEDKNKTFRDDFFIKQSHALEIIADVQELLVDSVREIVSHNKKWSSMLKKDLQKIQKALNKLHDDLCTDILEWNEALIKKVKETLA